MQSKFAIEAEIAINVSKIRHEHIKSVYEQMRYVTSYVQELQN